MSVVDERYTKKFAWRIENFSSITNKCLQSPTFESNSIKWELKICPANSEGRNNLMLQKLDSRPRFTLDYSIAFLDSEGSILLWKERKNIVFGFQQHGLYSNRIHSVQENNIDAIDIESEDVFGSRKFKIFSYATLIVECRMWFKENILISRPETVFACTRLEPTPIKKTKKIVLIVSDVSSLAPDFNSDYVEPMEGTESNENLLTIQLSLNSEETFFVKLTSCLYQMQANFKTYLIDVTHKIIEFTDVQSDINEKNQVVTFDTKITKLMIMSYRNQYLRNDELTFLFQYTLLCRISLSRLVSETEYFASNTQPIALPCSIPLIKPRPVTPKIEQTNDCDSPNSASQALERIYKEGFLTDFSLRAQEKTFPVHKVILGSRSSVFRAMFTADMKEKESGCVDIPDVDADTLQKMLKFIYCDSIEEDMEWESVSSLYTAADKYAVGPLKTKCADMLKAELSTSSVFGVLIVADNHCDQDLKDTALDFILENDKEIVGTELWRQFAEENGKLAFEAIQKLYVKKMDM